MTIEVVSKSFTLYAVYIETTDNTDQLISGITNCSLDLGLQNVQLGADGAVYDTFVALMRQQPKFTFTTKMCATALATCGVNGIKIDSDTDDVGMVFYFQQMSEGGTRGGASSNISLTVNEGLLYPVSVSASHGGEAEVTYELMVGYDGTNAPIVVAIDQSLEGTASVSESYTLGPVNINGTNMEGIQNANINFGINAMSLGADGSPYDTFQTIMRVVPSATFSTLDMEAINTLGIGGLKQSDTDSVFYLRKMSEGGTRVANATEEHISFTVDEGKWDVQNMSAAHGSVGNANIICIPTYDSTNSPFVIDTTAAIS